MVRRMVPAILSAYYAALDAGDDDGAAAAFAEDAVYMRPAFEPARGAPEIEVIRGRAGIRELFARRSERKKLGENLHRHEFRSVVVDGAECFIEGLGVNDDGPYAVFLAHATVGENGLITRYMAMFTETPAGLTD
jgi:ketosteroid isomerase-like protein